MENGYYDGRTDEQLRSGGTAETDREAINDKIALYAILHAVRTNELRAESAAHSISGSGSYSKAL